MPVRSARANQRPPEGKSRSRVIIGLNAKSDVGAQLCIRSDLVPELFDYGLEVAPGFEHGPNGSNIGDYEGPGWCQETCVRLADLIDREPNYSALASHEFLWVEHLRTLVNFLRSCGGCCID
jgi:hypothetical protein